MGIYYNIEISANRLNSIIEYLEEYATNLNDYFEIEDVVHTVDFLEKEVEQASIQNNKELQEWIKWQETLPDFCEFLSKKFGYDEDELNKARIAYLMAVGKEKEEINSDD